MKDDIDPTIVSDAPNHVVPESRAKLKALLSTNPNYFGTVEGSTLPVVEAMSGDTTYEELEYVSFNPEQSLLEATVSVKRPFGYGGDLCQTGSHEYVKFFLDYGSGWVDSGVASIEVHDIPNGIDCFDDPRLPLSYSATLKVDIPREWCKTPVLPKVRVILSWQVIPTGPNFKPVWGDVQDCAVQIAPRPPIVLDVVSVLSSALGTDLKLPDDFAYAGPVPLPGLDPEELGLAELAKLYGQSKSASSEHAAPAPGHAPVPAHRFGFAQLALAQSSAAIGAEVVAQNVATWAAAGLNWVEAATAINEVDADVSYEQLECLGLDNNVDRLTATLRVKRPSGYNGGLCDKGSREYV
ncbi:MAG: hypothetical protein M3256_24610, partial [Actinomycetota bacterium]|nr:hypothetical protein [Actinomycetota bacterium]